MIVVAGPTGSSKSSIAVKLAKALSGYIVNCDSVQIYKNFIIGAGQPESSDLLEVEHFLYQNLEPNEVCTVGKYEKLASKYVDPIFRSQSVPIVVGGTFLYLNALLYGLADLPEDEKIRSEISKLSTDDIYQKLIELGSSAIDPSHFTAIHKNDRIRLHRALETALLGVDIKQSHLLHRKPEYIKRPALIIVPIWPRNQLYDRIEQRCIKMMQLGLIEEVNQILANYPNAQALDAIGYKEVVEGISKNKSYDEILASIIQNTRRFAKRQLTWLRNEPKKRGWIIRPSDLDRIFSLEEDLSRFAKQDKVKGIPTWDLNFDALVNNIKDHLKNGINGVSIWFVPASQLV